VRLEGGLTAAALERAVKTDVRVAKYVAFIMDGEYAARYKLRNTEIVVQWSLGSYC